MKLVWIRRQAYFFISSLPMLSLAIVSFFIIVSSASALPAARRKAMDRRVAVIFLW